MVLFQYCLFCKLSLSFVSVMYVLFTRNRLKRNIKVEYLLELYTIPPMGIKKYLLLFLFISFAAESRPISYSGGSTLMAMSDNMKSSLFYHYSPSYKYSIGLEAVNDKYFDKNYSNI